MSALRNELYSQRYCNICIILFPIYGSEIVCDEHGKTEKNSWSPSCILASIVNIDDITMKCVN